MITGSQLRAARALLGISQKVLAARARISLPTVQRMEASGGNVRGTEHTLTNVVTALEVMGVELITDHAVSHAGGRGVRFKTARVATKPSRRRR